MKRSRFPAPWLFAIVAAPYGCFNGVVAVAIPYILRRHGLTLERVAELGALIQAPTIWYFLWAPLVDIGLRRRDWLIVLSLASGASATLALDRAGESSLGLMTGLFVAASVLNQPISSAVGGLVATAVPDALRGRTGGWSQAGIVAGGILAGGVAVWLTDHSSARLTAIVAGVLIAFPAFAALAIDEPAPSTERVVEHVRSMLRDVGAMLERRTTWVGFLFFLSPIGASALMNLFSAAAVDYHTSSAGVITVVALAGVLTPVGALLGGVLCDRFDRWLVYPGAGMASAVSAGLMLLAPLTPASYVIGAAGYALTTGLAYAAFMSLAFQLVGAGSAASGTRFTLLMAAVNVPVVYMMRLDGWGHARFGVHGMLAIDALANAAFGAVFVLGMFVHRRVRRPATATTTIERAADA